MAKLCVVSAFLFVAFFVLVAEASFRTTISTVVEEESESQQSQRPRCQQQIQQSQRQLHQCQHWLFQGSRGDEQQQQHRRCCQGLENLDRQCRCEAVSHIVQQQQRYVGMPRGQRQEEMMEKAMYLPDSCNLEPRQCQVQSPSFQTTINTIVEVDNESQQPQRCQQQIQRRQQQLRQCQQWVSQAGQNDMDSEDEYPRGSQQQQQQHRQCCQGLESLDRQCRCEAVSQIVQQQQQQGQGERQRSERQEQIMEKARFLPDSCNLEPRQCQVQRLYY